MTHETVRLRLERSRTENTVNGIATLVSVALVYYSLHPAKAQEHADRIRTFCQTWIHRISVAQAIAAIRSLPETRDHS